MLHVQTQVNLRLLKPLLMNEVMKMFKPLMGGLFETIDCFVDAAAEHRGPVGGSLHINWDFQVQFLLQTTMEKGSNNIHVNQIQPKLDRLRK